MYSLNELFGKILREKEQEKAIIEATYNTALPCFLGIFAGISLCLKASPVFYWGFFVLGGIVISLAPLTIPRKVPEPPKQLEYTPKKVKWSKKKVAHPTLEPVVTVEDNANEVKEKVN